LFCSQLKTDEWTFESWAVSQPGSTQNSLLKTQDARAAQNPAIAGDIKAQLWTIGFAMSWITDVEGIKVGHFTDSRRPTGCTVVLYESGAVAGVDVRGSAPGTRETDLLNPINTVDKVHAIVLSGGSAFGLDTATGVMRWLEERDYGYQTVAAKVPIVPAAILYDLTVGDSKIRPDAEAGYRACMNAKSGPVEEGTVGAGAGATVGKLAGGTRMKGGIGTASITLPNGIVVGAIVAVNSVGDIFDSKTGKIVAGARAPGGKKFLNIMEAFRSGNDLTRASKPGESTTIGVVATNASFDKTQMTKIAQMAHDGIARAINPTHTPFDGDTLFAISTGSSVARVNHGIIGALAAEAVSEAILRAVIKANAN
jgi:L-aminopeptidase/D-esterase-like protein